MRAAAIFFPGIVGNVGAHCRVESRDGRKTGLARHAIQLGDEGLDRVGLGARRLLDAIFAVQPRRAVLVEDLPGDLSRLRQNGPPELGVGQRPDVGALIEEALAIGVDDDPFKIVVAFEHRAELKLVHVRRVEVPACRMAARPVAERHGAAVERHAKAVAGVETRPAHLGEIP